MRYRDRYTGQIKILVKETCEYFILRNSDGKEENWERETFANTWEKMA